jgi:hypothetical protein
MKASVRSAALILGVLSVTSCNVDSRHRIIVYDQPWSSAAAVQNLVCADDQKAACEAEAKQGLVKLTENLPAIFRDATECRTVQFLVASPDADEQLKEALNTNRGNTYWLLRIDFHPRLQRQPFSLGPGMERPDIGGDDVEQNADFICKAAKHNGVIGIW